MARSAHVQSIDAIRQFRADLQAYEESLRQTLDILSAELKHAADYFDSDRTAYWPAQVRRASDRVAEARSRLERCELSTGPDEGPSCYEEKKALRRAKQRLSVAEQKVKATRKWVRIVKQELDEFQSRLGQVQLLADSDLPRANLLLARMLGRLERYAGQRTNALDASPTASRGE